MIKSMVIIGIVLACCAGARADYLSDRKAALELVKGGKNDEALSLFTKMAASAASDLQKSDALEQAVGCANRLKQYDRGLGLTVSHDL